MWNSYKKFNRLKEALEYRGLDPDNMSLSELFEAARKRLKTDRKLNDFIWDFLRVFEPPSCMMMHCKRHGTQGEFCECIDGKIPSRCGIHKKFLKRQKEKKKKEKTDDR